MKSLILFLSILCLSLATNATSPKSVVSADNGTFQLKGKPIPPSGVVIFSDIGGNLGSDDGLFCAVNDGNVPLDDIFWTFPDKQPILQRPSVNKYGNGTCEYMDHCVSLYYSGTPAERGQFKCVLVWRPDQPGQPLYYEVVPVNIVDMNVSDVIGPNHNIIAGENIELSVNVSMDPNNTAIPYQWQLNETDLDDSSTYTGTKTATLRITKIQDNNKGKYRVSFAHSESGFTNDVTINIITIRAEIVPNQKEPPWLGSTNYTLICNVSVTGADRISLQSLNISYLWLKNSNELHQGLGSMLSFERLTYDDIGNYSCQVSLNSTSLSQVVSYTPTFLLTSRDVIYQLSLDILEDNCNHWIQSDTQNKADAINQQIIKKINTECGDNTIDAENGIKIDKHGYKCRNAQDDHVVYNVHLLETANANVTQLVDCMDSWIKLSNPPTILITGAEYDLDKDCSGVLIDRDSTPYICSFSPQPTELDVGSSFAIALAVIVIFLLFIFGAIIVGVIVKKRCDNVYYEPLR